MMKPRYILTTLIVIFLLSACGGGNESDDSSSLTAEVNQLFPYSDNTPLKVFFNCQRAGSSLNYDFDFKGDDTLEVRFVDDLNREWLLNGNYNFSNGKITLEPIDTLTFLAEKSQDIQTFMGMMISFNTIIDDTSANPGQIVMQCVAVGHRYGDPSRETRRNYNICDAQTFKGLTYDNAFEFTALSSVHTQYPVPGAIFRHREWLNYQNILQGWGIYRRIGNTYYAYFGTQFDDENLIKGEFVDNDQHITIPSLGIECRL